MKINIQQRERVLGGFMVSKINLFYVLGEVEREYPQAQEEVFL